MKAMQLYTQMVQFMKAMQFYSRIPSMSISLLMIVEILQLNTIHTMSLFIKSRHFLKLSYSKEKCVYLDISDIVLVVVQGYNPLNNISPRNNVTQFQDPPLI